VRVAAVVADLMTYSRIEGAAVAAGAVIVRADDPDALPDDPFDLLLVDWSARADGWGARLSRRRDARVVVFGPHTDLEAHAAARGAGLGPMWARSKLVAELPRILAGRD
jgi:GNAT superfamily N-acetyltransferase